jgi:alpha-1,3-mannosyltransferase
MNVLLFAPGLFLLLLQVSDSLYHVIYRLFVYCALPQLVLGAPFLLHHPVHYLRKAFELDRVFFYQWTVNWKFLPEEVFVSKPLSVALLLLHIGGLIYFAVQWLQSLDGSNSKRRIFVFRQPSPTLDDSRPIQTLSPIYITSTLFTSNFIGICFARTLHYQFYCWYFHALPFLLWYSSIETTISAMSSTAMTYPWMLRIAFLLCLEYSFLTFPATPFSSAVLQLAHLAILIQIRPPPMFLCTKRGKVD